MSPSQQSAGNTPDSRSGDRGFGVMLFALALFVGYRAWQMDVPFAYDPLGPRAFPLVLAGALAVMSLVMIWRPAPGTGLPRGTTALKLVGVLGILFLYAVLFTRVGYLSTTVIAMAVLARIFGASWIKAVITGALLALGSYGLFVYALDIVLPAGTWFVE